MNIKSIIKIIIGVFGTILLGAIGSGLWERIIGPLIDSLMKLSINSINFFFITYKDSIYKEASNGFHEFYSLQLWILILMLIPLLYIRLLQTHPENKKRKIELSSSHTPFKLFIISNKGYWSIYSLTLIIIVLIVFNTLRHNYINQTTTYAMTSMEILKPYITENEYLLLRSEYYSMSNALDFEKFYLKLNVLSKKNNLNLHEFKPL